MKTTSAKWWTSFVALFALLAHAEAPTDERFRFKISPPTAAPGERVRVEISLNRSQSPAAQDWEPRIYDQFLLAGKDYVVLDSDHQATPSGWRWNYDLTAYQPQQITLPPIAVAYGPESYSTEATTVTISGLRPDGDVALRDDYGSERLPFPWRKWFERLVMVAAAILSFKVIQRWWRKRPRRRQRFSSEVAIPSESPEEWLARQLEAMRHKLNEPATVETGAVELVDEFSYTLRGYFARRTLQPVETYTTGEFSQLLGEEPHSVFAGKMLKECDTFRFSSPQKSSALSLIDAYIGSSEKVLLA